MKSINRLLYCQYLYVSQINYTLTNLADHIEGLSHDKINRYLKNAKLSSSLVWEHSKEDVIESKNGYLLFDDTVINKEYSVNIELARRQYSGNTHSITTGIGVVTCVYYNPEVQKFWITDYRIYDPDKDGKTKMDHLEDMLEHTLDQKKLFFKNFLVDSWYATHKIMLKIDSLEKIYYCPVKKNRLVIDKTQDDKSKTHQSIETLYWSEEELKKGKTVTPNKFPKEKKVKLFQITISTNRIDYVITNQMNQNSSDDTRNECAIRWKIEEFHREIKQVTGLEKCQCRKSRIQRNHSACAMLVWIHMKRYARSISKTIYEVKHQL